MKKYLKVLLSLLLALVCLAACVSCDNGDGGQEGPGSNQDGPGGTAVVETYKINFVYSYTTKIINEYGRPKTEKESLVVKTIEVPKSNTGLTDAQREEINSILYHGYGFAEWYQEQDWVVDDENSTQYPNPSSTPFDFTKLGTVTSDLTFYATKGDLAGRDAHWSIEEVTAVNDNGVEVITDVVLKITGNGAMFDYENTNAVDIPWYGYSVSEGGKEIRNFESITKIVIGSGITSIGRNAFKGLTGVTAVEFEDNSKLSYIGEASFKEQSNLKTLKTPDSLVTIDKNAFENTGLTSLWLNEGLTTISDSAFSGAKGISWIILPSTVKTIGVAAFHPGAGSSSTAHSLAKIYYTGTAPKNSDGSENYAAAIFGTLIDTGMDNGALTSKATVYYYKKYTASDSTAVKGAYWYYTSEVETFADSPVEPTAYCLTLKYYLPGSPLSAEWIDYVPATLSYEIGKNGTGSYKLSGKISYDNLTFREDNVQYHGYKFATYGDEGKYTLNGAKSDFCEGAKVVENMTCTLSRGNILAENGGVVFTYSGGILTVLLDDAAIKEGASDAIWNFTHGEDTAALWTGNTTGVKNITTVDISEGITYIGTLAFNNLISVNYILVPASVKGIAASAFDACTNLKSIYYAGDLNDCIIYDAQGNPTDKTLADASSVSNFSNITFYEYTAGATDADGSYWTTIDGKYLAWTLTTDATTSDKSLYIAGDNEMVNFANDTAAPWYSQEVVANLKTVTFANTILTIGENVLHMYSAVETINLSGNVTKIPATAFAGTALLENTSAYEGGVLVINNLLIRVDSRRKNVDVFEIDFGITLVASGAFDGCDKIKELIVPSTVRNINDNAFAGLTSLNVIYTEALTSAWKNVSANSGYKSNVFVCGYDDNDIDGDKNTNERLWYRDSNGEVKLHDGFCVYCYDENGNTTHADGNSTCKHLWGDWYTYKLPTHTVNGILARKCTVEGCNALDYDKDTLLKVSEKVNGQYVHTYGEYVLDEVTYCEQNRTMSAKCLYCTERDVVVLTGTSLGGHKYGEYTVNANSATCYGAGTMTAVCQNPYCNHENVVEDPNQPMLEHTYGTPTRKSSADCLAEFNYYVKCTNEGCTHEKFDHSEPNENIQAHNWIQQVADKYIALRATVNSSNVYYLSCSKCGVSCKSIEGVENKTFVNYGSQVKTYEWDDDVLSSIITSSGKYDVVSNLDKFHYATTVIYGAKKVLEVGKNADAADAVLNIKNSNVLITTGNITHEFETDFKLGEIVGTADYVYRMGLSNGTDSFFDIYFILNGNTVTVKDGFGADATVFGSFNKNNWVNIAITYDATLRTTEIDETPTVDPSDPDYDPDYVPEQVIRTEYYYNVNVTVGASTKTYKQVVASADSLNNSKVECVESEINAGLTTARVYLEDTFIRSISEGAASVDENTTPDPEDPPVEPGDNGEPQYKFDEDKSDDDLHVETPADGITVTIKDGQKDSDGYVYVQSNVLGGMLNVSTVANNKGPAFTSSTVFTLAGKLGENANKLYVFESDLVIGAGTHNLVFSNSALSLHSFALDLSIKNGSLVIADAEGYEGLNGELNSITVAGITSATTFNLRVELYRVTTTSGEKLVAKIYVNDIFVGTSDAAATSANKVRKYDIDVVAIYHNIATDTKISFDNVYATLSDESVVYIPEVLD